MIKNLLNYKIIRSPLRQFQSVLTLHTLQESSGTEKAETKCPDLDFKYLCSPENTANIKCSIQNRKASGDLDKVIKLYEDYIQSVSNVNRCDIERNLIKEALRIPNKSHPCLQKLNNEPSVIKTIFNSQERTFKLVSFETLVKKLNLIKAENLADLVGPRSYILFESLAELEEALIQYSLKHLVEWNFQIISIPDILDRNVIEYCGMDTRGERTQVYTLDNKCGSDICLSGTAEMGIAHFLQGKVLKKSESPLRLAAVSRCFRAETSKISSEKGIYRVHQFTKVEMFGVTKSLHSDHMLNEFVSIQESLFSKLGLDLRVLDMPECELGAQAYRKFDIECFMPGRKYWGELSSASNCTDYQSRRLNIKYEDGSYADTINGTACAVPRLLIAILETHQKEDGTINIPEVLIPFMGKDTIKKSKVPKLNKVKHNSK